MVVTVEGAGALGAWSRIPYTPASTCERCCVQVRQVAGPTHAGPAPDWPSSAHTTGPDHQRLTTSFTIWPATTMNVVAPRLCGAGSRPCQQQQHPLLTPVPQARLPQPFLATTSSSSTSRAASGLTASTSTPCGAAGAAVPSSAPRRRASSVAASAASPAMGSAAPQQQADSQQEQHAEPGGGERCLICTSVTANNLDDFIGEIHEAVNAGVDVVELRLDFLRGFDPAQDLDIIMQACPLPFIVTYRPAWEG